MAEITLTLASHYFKVTKLSPRGRQIAELFAKKMVQWGWQRSGARDYIHAALKVFAAATADRTEFRFHINQLKDFQLHLEFNNFRGDMVEIFQLPIPDCADADFIVQSKWSDREHQVPVIEYLTKDAPPFSKFVDLQTGKGKSYCSMRGGEKYGVRIGIVVKPMYLDKWVEDIHRTYEIAVEDIVVVRGSKHLMALLLAAEAGDLTAKIVIISNKTFQNWIKLYEKFKEETLDMGYACLPEQWCEHLGIGYRLIDEVHQDFHLNFKLDLYTNVARSLALSATMISDDDFINKMYEIAYPAYSRYKGPAYDKYIAAKAVIYRLKQPNEVRYKDPISKNYSHHVYEQWILRNEQRTANYFDLINQVVKGAYIDKKKAGQRMAVYCASIEMCTLVTAYLKKKYPSLDIRRYVGEDPYEDLMEPDIRVTTLGSAGTAVDIPDLLVVLLTTCVASSQGNVQGLGRLRKLSDGSLTEFYYFVCEDVSKQIEYHEKKKALLEHRTVSFKCLYIGTSI